MPAIAMASSNTGAIANKVKNASDAPSLVQSSSHHARAAPVKVRKITPKTYQGSAGSGIREPGAGSRGSAIREKRSTSEPISRRPIGGLTDLRDAVHNSRNRVE